MEGVHIMRNFLWAFIALYGCEVAGPQVAVSATSNDGYADASVVDLGEDATGAVQETADATVASADVVAVPDATTEVYVGVDTEDVMVDSDPDAVPEIAAEIQEDVLDVQLSAEVTVKDTGPDPCAGANCDDGNACTDDTCDKAKGCLHAPNALFCDDKNVCTTGDKCTAGACVAGSFAGLSPTCSCQFDVQCADSDTCTVDKCVNYQCTHALPGTVCSCEAFCGTPKNSDWVCSCTSDCVAAGNCCTDYKKFCVP